MTKIFSYVVRYDSGFAPNPFGKYCSLATCKPRIRKKVQKDDWIIGTGSVENVGNDRLIYAMKVGEKLTFEQYSKDKRFQYKIPNWKSNDPVKRLGDNIYYNNENNVFIQRPSKHSNKDGTENKKLKEHDLSGENVLISQYFCYYGKNALQIPHDFQFIIKKGPGHKCNFSESEIHKFFAWLNTPEKIKGRQGDPFLMKKDIDICYKYIEYDGTLEDDED